MLPRTALWVVWTVWACSPALDLPDVFAFALTVQPESPSGTLPLSFRARAAGAAGDEAWLFVGELSEAQRGLVRKGKVSGALRARAVPLFQWSEGDALWLQPLEWLRSGESYSLAVLGQSEVRSFLAYDTGQPRAELVLPSQGPAVRVAVECGPLPRASPLELQLAPSGGALHPLDLPLGEAERRCTAWIAGDTPQALAVAPPLVDDRFLAPVVFGPPAETSAPSEAPRCAGYPTHGSCVEVLDDRILLTAFEAERLWLLAEPEPRAVVATPGRRVLLTRGLKAETAVRIGGTVLGQDGVPEPLELELTTAPAMPHLVLTEVLANPLGTEPGSEWLELVNDAEAPAPLDGLWLADGAGRFALPAAVLAPGEVALLVPRGFSSGSGDVPVLPSTRRLELPSLGARGLSNSGEPLTLFGSRGVVSRFPALPAPSAGRSMARLRLSARDDEPTAFAEHGEPGASPGVATWQP
jgi:hypothetical protein